MRPLNFLNSRHFEKQKKIKFWHSIIFILIFLIFILALFFQVKELLAYYRLKDEYNILNTYIENQNDTFKNKQELNKKHKNLKLKIDQINKLNNQPHIILKEITSSIPEDSYICEFEYKNLKDITIKGSAKNSDIISNFLKQLSKNANLPKFNLNSIKQKDNTILFEFKAILFK